jgi:hypothetical protein
MTSLTLQDGAQRNSTPATNRLRRIVVLTTAAFALASQPACKGSILRNAAEAGYETITDAPPATPVPAR